MKALLPTAALSINIAFGYTMNITLNGQTFTATLADTQAADALQQQLPLTLNLRDYNRNEKVGPLPQTLPTNDEAGRVHRSRRHPALAGRQSGHLLRKFRYAVPLHPPWQNR